MNKVAQVGLIVFAVSIVYLLLLLVMPVIIDVAATTNATLTATTNMTNYPGSSETLIAAPWVLFFIPGGIGLTLIIIILKTKP